MPSLKRAYMPLAVLTLLIAFWLRTWQLDHYPYGPQYDEAVYLILARDAAFHGVYHFPIVNAYQGREMLYMYLAAPMLQYVIDDVYALRLTSVFCNLLTIAASIALGKTMFRGERGVAIGLIVGAIATLSFPQVFLARQAFRAVSLPLMQALALLFLWRGLNTRKRDGLWLTAGGFFAGAALYTYMASRLFPVWLLLGGVCLFWLDRHRWRTRLRQGLVFFGVLAITALPMGSFALQNPDIFLGRLEEVTSSAGALTLWESIVVHAQMFFVQGEWLLRYNIPLRPYFTPLEGAALVIGMLIAAWRMTRRDVLPSEKTAGWLALLSPLMVLPSVISVGGYPPNFMRSLGMIPLIFVLVAIGFEFTLARVRRWLPLLLIIVLPVGALLVNRLYLEWASTPDLYTQNDQDMVDAARWIAAQNLDNTQVYVGAQDRDHPSLMIYPVPEVIWLGGDSLFRPPAGQTGIYIFTHTVAPPAAWEDWLSQGAIADVPRAPDGQPAFSGYRLTGDTPLPASTPPSEAVITPYMTLIGSLLPAVEAGVETQAEFHWRIGQPIPYSDLMPVLTVEDAIGTILYRSDVNTTGTHHWKVGSVLMQRMTISAPLGTPPGQYAVYVNWWSPSNNVFVPFLDQNGRQAGLRALAGYIEVARPAVFPTPESLDIAVRHAQSITAGLTLLGWTPPQSTMRPGETLPLTLFWRAEEASREDTTLQVILRSDQGAVTLGEVEPVSNYPTSQWQTGETLRAPLLLPTPRDLPNGRYTLLIEIAEQEIMLGEVEIAGLPRLYQAPDVTQLMNVRLGDALTLYGYTLQTGQPFNLTLVWYADQSVNEDYTVFVHVVDANGVTVTQRDVMPRDNSYPTSLWDRGEYVVDPHTFTDLPAGRYTLRIGMYLQATGERLTLDSGGDMIEISFVQP
jgi:hypothetical protein